MNVWWPMAGIINQLVTNELQFFSINAILLPGKKASELQSD